ncbi:MAG: hypothetical protein WCJ30_00460 [Deltaproteobacteria bacterium]
MDDTTAPVMLPFPFVFFGCADTDAWVSSNGILGLGSTASNEYNNLCATDPGALRGTILVFWDDLQPRGGVCVATTGRVGSRAFVVQWQDMYFYQNDVTAHLDFEVVLHEGTSAIDMIYREMSDGREPGRASGLQATIGLVDQSGASPVQYSCNASVIHAPQAIRFTPR